MKEPVHIDGEFYFDPADKIYADHFPGNPVVPGSLITHAFLEAGKKAGLKGKRLIIEGFKFREFVPPGRYSFSIEAHSNRMKCRLYPKPSEPHRTLVTGTIKR